MSRQYLIWGGVGLVIVAVVAFIALGHGTVGPAGSESGSQAAQAVDFNYTVYQQAGASAGDNLHFSKLFNNGKPVVLNFWAARCPACQAEMPGFERVYKDLGQQVQFIGIDVGPYTGLGTHDQARVFLKQHHITYAAGYADSSKPVQQFKITGMPTTIMFTPDGKVFGKWTGYLDEAKLRSKLSDLIAASK